jgi:hypothetical protein
MVIGFILGILATLVVQSVYDMYVKNPVVEEIVVPAAKKVQKSRAKKSKKG